jgi:hypothetical protein
MSELAGYVYVAENREQGFCKVGSTADARNRALDLLSIYGLRFRYCVEVDRPRELERYVHLELGEKHRVMPLKRETYALPVSEIVETICQIGKERSIRLLRGGPPNGWVPEGWPRPKIRASCAGRVLAANMIGVSIARIDELIDWGVLDYCKGHGESQITMRSIKRYLACLAMGV